MERTGKTRVRRGTDPRKSGVLEDEGVCRKDSQNPTDTETHPDRRGRPRTGQGRTRGDHVSEVEGWSQREGLRGKERGSTKRGNGEGEDTRTARRGCMTERKADRERETSQTGKERKRVQNMDDDKEIEGNGRGSGTHGSDREERRVETTTERIRVTTSRETTQN